MIILITVIICVTIIVIRNVHTVTSLALVKRDKTSGLDRFDRKTFTFIHLADAFIQSDLQLKHDRVCSTHFLSEKVQ